MVHMVFSIINGWSLPSTSPCFFRSLLSPLKRADAVKQFFCKPSLFVFRKFCGIAGYAVWLYESQATCLITFGYGLLALVCCQNKADKFFNSFCKLVGIGIGGFIQVDCRSKIGSSLEISEILLLFQKGNVGALPVLSLCYVMPREIQGSNGNCHF